VHPRDIPDILDLPGQRQLAADVAFKDDGEAPMYAYNTEASYRGQSGKLPEYKLDGTRYWISADVHAGNAPKLTGWFELMNGPADALPVIRPLPGKPQVLRTD
jgi:hypothetical protein